MLIMFIDLFLKFKSFKIKRYSIYLFSLFFLIFCFSVKSKTDDLISKKKMVLLCVDCYGSSSHTVKIVKHLFGNEIDFEFIHVQTVNKISYSYQKSWEQTQSLYHIKYDIDLAASSPKEVQYRDGRNVMTLDQLISTLEANNKKVHFAFSGMDIGAMGASEINRALNIQQIGYNSPDTKEWRNDKSLMQKQLWLGRIPTYPVRTVIQAQNIMNLIANSGYQQIIIKISKSSGSQGVRIINVNDKQELQSVFHSIMALKVDKHGNKINELIMQPRIGGAEGIEFAVNTISDGANPIITAAWKYNKIERSDGLVYFVDRSVDLSEDIIKKITPVLNDAARNLDHRYGPGHWEFMLDEQKRIFLIEMGPRVGGSDYPIIDKAVYGIDQLSLEILRVIDPKKFQFALQKIKKVLDGAIFSAISPEDGSIVKGTASLIRSFKTLTVGDHIVDGSVVKRTIDLGTSPFTIAFVGPYADVKADATTFVEGMISGKFFEHNSSTNGKCVLLFGKMPYVQKVQATFEKVFK